ncbi:phosphatidylserine decarboxylase [Linnemannia gamsii]|uniref:Phosphatidylserine decarboxylase n=1 Tax=Linnemannia gamsii TaxID=64522 RepID=A0ABQ7JT56_9FUNG|nr:phosphatidylserine decarboxylase [Linnemannia gamsii]
MSEQQQQQQQQQDEHATATAAATAEWAELTTVEEYVHKCAGRLEATVANSCASEDEGQPLSDGGILTSANHKTWFPYVHPYKWVHKLYKAYRYGNYVVVDRKTGKTEWEDMPVKLKEGARPIDSKDDPTVITSAADSRLACFDSISTAQEFWIKGQKFTLATFLQDSALASEFDQGSMAIFRLAPQDYHRFHSPVKGTVVGYGDKVEEGEASKRIGGTYFTVNPMAVNENLDVFTENVRVVSVLDLDQGGEGVIGSIDMTGGKVPGTKLEKGDELGYFAYGGSTCILLFKKNAVQFDQDLTESSKKGVETLVRVGEQIGRRN